MQIGRSRLVLQQPLAIGTMQWGTSLLDKWLTTGGPVTDSQLQEVVDLALQENVTLFDTAEGYGGGSSETRLRRLLYSKVDESKSRQESIAQGSSEQSRPEPIVCTKFLPTIWRWTKAGFRRSLQGSLDRLGLKAIPLYFIHTPVHPRFSLFCECVAEAANEGLIEAIGLSNCGPEHIELAHRIISQRGQRIACNQVLINLLSFKSPVLQETIALCRKLDITLMGYSPIGQGLLTEGLTATSIQRIRGARIQSVRFQDPELMRLRETVANIATKRGVTMAQVCINWSITHGFIPLIGCKNAKHVRDATGALGWRLNSDEMNDLDAVAMGRSTLEKGLFRRAIFVILISCLTLGYWILGLFGL